MSATDNRIMTDATCARIADALEYFVENYPVPTLIEKTITEKGTYSASNDNADGYSQVTVNIPTTPLLFEVGNYFGDSSGEETETLNCELSGPVGSTAILIIMHRDTVSIPSMTLVYSYKNPVVLSSSTDQWLSVYTKAMTSTPETITITQASSKRMCACSFFVGSNTIISEPTIYAFDNGATNFQYTIQPSNKPRLAVIAHVWAGNATTTLSQRQLTLPVSLTSSTAMIRLAAFIIQNISPVVYTTSITASESASSVNRLLLFDLL